MGTVVGNKRAGADTDWETGPGVLSGTGRQLAGETDKEAEWLRGCDLLVIRNGGCKENGVMDTTLLSGLSAGRLKPGETNYSTPTCYNNI